MKDDALRPHHESIAQVGAAHRQAKVIERERISEVARADGRVRVQHGPMALLDCLPTESRIRAGVEWARRHAIDEQPIVQAAVVLQVEHVEKSDRPRIRVPLQHDLLQDLDDEAVPDEPLAGRVTKHVRPTELPQGAPEWDAGVVGDGVAGLALSALAVGLLVEVPSARQVEVRRLSAHDRRAERKNRKQARYGKGFTPHDDSLGEETCRVSETRQVRSVRSSALVSA